MAGQRFNSGQVSDWGKGGSPPAAAATFYFRNPRSWTYRVGGSGNAMVQDRAVFLGFVCNIPHIVRLMYIEVTASAVGSSCLLGIYEADVDGYPRNLLGSGSVTTTSNGLKTLTLSPTIPLQQNRVYYLAFCAVGGTPSVYGGAAAGGFVDGLYPGWIDNLSRQEVFHQNVTSPGSFDSVISGTPTLSAVVKPNIAVEV